MIIASIAILAVVVHNADNDNSDEDTDNVQAKTKDVEEKKTLRMVNIDSHGKD